MNLRTLLEVDGVTWARLTHQSYGGVRDLPTTSCGKELKPGNRGDRCHGSDFSVHNSRRGH
jgi:hypothetical protein